MAYLYRIVRSSLLVLSSATLLTACPDDPVVPGVGTDGSTGSPMATDTGSATCTPGQTQTCPCPGGAEGTQVCIDSGAGFTPCECEGTTLDSGSSDTAEPDTTTTADPTTTGDLGCEQDEDCAGRPTGECEVAVCGEDGECTVEAAEFDIPCGDPTDDECTDPDRCNNSGECLPHNVEEGLACIACPSGECTCSAGVCSECSVFAPTNNFITTRSIVGWDLTGSWGLHRQTPQSELETASEFPGQVLGTNGNRVAPFPGAEIETSYARTPPVELPPMIIFLSWHVDEGGGLSDNKTVRVSVDNGVTWDTLADCATDPSWVFCQPQLTADPAVFNLAQIPVPAALQGQTALVEFGYDTGDACCNFEKGWYIDSLNVATECACVADEDCAELSDDCGLGICAISGECALIPAALDTPCGDPFENECNGADGCDGVGYCRDNVAATGLDFCEDCPGGTCSFCDAGQCLDCQSFTNFLGFSDPSAAPWTVIAINGTPDWGLFTEAPPNEQGVLAAPFPNAPVYGTDGNRDAPYPGSEAEASQAITTPGLVPFEMIFGSWNVDEGSFFDTKMIDISVDGGITWEPLVNCETAFNSQPFCNNRDATRAMDDWDEIVLDTSAWAGQMGQLRFTHDTGDSCCGFERGWYLDFTYAICDDIAFQP